MASTVNTSHEAVMFMQLIFCNAWTEVRKQTEGCYFYFYW